MNRIITAARVHTVAPTQFLIMPWAIMASTFVFNILFWGRSGTGGLASLYIAVAIVYMQSVTLLLPFTMGLSLTRRTFYLGTGLFAAAQSLAYGVVLYGMVLIERRTDGWGVGMSFFQGYWSVSNPVLQVLVFAIPLFVLALLGMAVGVVYKRFGSAGLYSLTIGVVLLLGGLFALVIWQPAWNSVGGWLRDQSSVELFAGWPLVLGVLFAVAGYLGIRRVVP